MAGSLHPLKNRQDKKSTDVLKLSTQSSLTDQGVKYSIEASSSINTGVEAKRSHLVD